VRQSSWFKNFLGTLTSYEERDGSINMNFTNIIC